MDTHFLILLFAGAIAGGFVNGLAGFGTALFSLGFWLQIMQPEQAVAIVLLMSVFTGAQGVWIVRNDIDRKRLLRFLLPALPGIPIGVALLSLIEADTLKLGIACFLIFYGGFFLLNRNLPSLRDRTPAMDMIIGFIGGVLGGAAGLSGALPTMWCALKDWTKGAKRALLQPYNMTILTLAALGLAYHRVYTTETLLYFAGALPVAMISAQLGIFVFGKLSDTGFRTLLIALLFLSGLIIVVRELI